VIDSEKYWQVPAAVLAISAVTASLAGGLVWGIPALLLAGPSIWLLWQRGSADAAGDSRPQAAGAAPDDASLSRREQQLEATLRTDFSETQRDHLRTILVAGEELLGALPKPTRRRELFAALARNAGRA